MARTISMSIHGTEWADIGLDAAVNGVAGTEEYRNERGSGYGDDEGDWFSWTQARLADGRIYNILFAGTHGNDHSPWTSGNTFATLYDATDPNENREFDAEIKRWEAMPELLDDDSDDDCIPDCEPHGVEVNSIDTLGDDDSEDDIPAPDGWDAIDTSTEDSPPEFTLIVGNIGTIYAGPDEKIARSNFDGYSEQSRENVHSRAYGEDVTLLRGDDIIAEHIGHNPS